MVRLFVSYWFGADDGKSSLMRQMVLLVENEPTTEEDLVDIRKKISSYHWQNVVIVNWKVMKIV